jgi:hypothetical protein
MDYLGQNLRLLREKKRMYVRLVLQEPFQRLNAVHALLALWPIFLTVPQCVMGLFTHC